MGDYYIRRPDELYHYGIKGMKWGVRHDPERSSDGRSQKGMSTAKKVAIGVGVAAAVAGVTYVAVTKRNNRLARASVDRALRISGKTKVPAGGFNVKRGPGKLTRHTKRQTKFGASIRRNIFYNDKAAKAPLNENYFNKPSSSAKRRYESYADKAHKEANAMIGRYHKSGRTGYPEMYNKSPINRLRKQKGPKILRSR